MKPTVFQFDSAVVRTFADDKGEPWFNANDVCGVLGYRNPSDAIAKHCRESGVIICAGSSSNCCATSPTRRAWA